VRQVCRVLSTPKFELFLPYFGFSSHRGREDLKRQATVFQNLTCAPNKEKRWATDSMAFILEDTELHKHSLNKLLTVSSWNINGDQQSYR